MTETRTINTGGGQYIENVTGNYIQGNVNTHNFQGANFHNTEQHQSLAEAAQEIQTLLDQLSKTYPSDPLEQIAQVALTKIQGNPTSTQRLWMALEAGSVAALSQVLNHPAAAFFIEAAQFWKDSSLAP